jgi:hypothetical protein
MISKALLKPSSSNKQVQEYMAAVRKGMDSYFAVETHVGLEHPTSNRTLSISSLCH